MGRGPFGSIYIVPLRNNHYDCCCCSSSCYCYCCCCYPDPHASLTASVFLPPPTPFRPYHPSAKPGKGYHQLGGGKWAGQHCHMKIDPSKQTWNPESGLYIDKRDSFSMGKSSSSMGSMLLSGPFHYPKGRCGWSKYAGDAQGILCAGVVKSLRNPQSKLTQPMGTRDDVWSLLELLICKYN